MLLFDTIDCIDVTKIHIQVDGRQELFTLLRARTPVIYASKELLATASACLICKF